MTLDELRARFWWLAQAVHIRMDTRAIPRGS